MLLYLLILVPLFGIFLISIFNTEKINMLSAINHKNDVISVNDINHLIDVKNTNDAISAIDNKHDVIMEEIRKNNEKNDKKK